MCSSLPTVPVQISNTCTDTFSLWPPHISSPGPAQQLLREVCHVLAASQVLRQKLPARRSLPLEILQTQRETTAPSREAAAKGSPGSKEDRNGQVRGIRAPRRQRCVRWGQRCVRCVREGGKDRVTSPCPTGGMLPPNRLPCWQSTLTTARSPHQAALRVPHIFGFW